MNARTDREHIFTVALFFVFVAVLLLALLMGTGAYRRIHAAGARSDDARLSNALVANIVRSKDATGAVRTEDAPEGGAALVLTEQLASGTFETRLYLVGDRLVEEYAPESAPYDPEHAVELADTTRFDVALDRDLGLVAIATDDGETVVALRSAGAIDDAGGGEGR